MANFCSECGARIHGDKGFCPVCGEIIERKPKQGSPAQPPQIYRQGSPAQPQQIYRQAKPAQPQQIYRQGSSAQPPREYQQRRVEPPPEYQRTRQPTILQQHQNDAGAQTLQGDRETRSVQQRQQPRQQQPQQEQEIQPRKRKRGKRAAVVLTVILVIIIAAVGYAWLYLRSAISNAPDMRANPRGSELVNITGSASGPGTVGGAVRNTSKYTFLILGADYGEYNTDVIMSATFDTSEHTFNVVNIPRDTLVNVSWNTKKANSLLANMRARHQGEDDAEAKAMQSTVEAFADILGYEADYWVFVNIQAFVALIDAIGGVDFDVPVNMNYDDRAGGLSIHYTQGAHHLTGQQALEVLRFRAGYANADIGRIGTQQSFLKSAAEQILAKSGSLRITELARIFLSNVKTDMKLDDLIWFGNEFLKLEPDNINFHMMPGNTGDSVRSQSYVTIYVDEWLKLINGTFNPFNSDVTAGDVSILTRGSDKRLYVTDGNRRGDPAWGT